MKGFKITYDTITPESAEIGEYADSGWLDEEGVTFELDHWDIEEGLTEIDLATAWLRDQGGSCLEASCSGNLTDHDWFTAYECEHDYATGGVTNHSFHPFGFTGEELTEIKRRLNA